MNNLIILTDDDGFIGQHMNRTTTLNFNLIKDNFEKENFKVTSLTFSEAIDFSFNKKDIVLCFSSQIDYIKSYLDDILLYLTTKFNFTLIPSLNLIKAHENKGYQELYKKIIDLQSLEAQYYTKKSLLKNLKNINYPVVFKKNSGAGSIGVSLVKNDEELLNKVKDVTNVDKAINYLSYKAKKIIKQKGLQKDTEIEKNKTFVLQEFIQNLQYDYKILVFFDKYFIIRRHIRKNDFRASGGGSIEFDPEINKNLLNFAQQVFQKINSPMCSLDICFNEKNYYLIEFQAVHFGPTGHQKSNLFYQQDNSGDWKKHKKEDNSLEKIIVESYIKYFKNNNII